MTDKEILMELRKSRNENEKLLKKLVEEKVRLTSKKEFSVQEIKYYSQFLSVSMNKLLKEILLVKEEDYKKFLKGNIKIIKSDKFNEEKDRYIREKRNIYKYRVNWNKRNYYNKEKLVLKANKFSVNVYDFSVQILGKTITCVRRVVNCDDNKKRFYIGKYVNCELPQGYYENNFQEINSIVKYAVRKASYKFGVKFDKDRFNDEIQKNIEYIWYNGNYLNKFGKPAIKGVDLKPRHRKVMYTKIFYNEINEIKKGEIF